MPKLISVTDFTQPCNKKCQNCTIKAIPLRLCKRLTTHKSPGITIREGDLFTKVVVYLYKKADKDKITAGLELFMLTRVKYSSDLAFGNKGNSLNVEQFQRIGKSQVNTDRRKFVKELKDKALSSQQQTIQAITTLNSADDKTFNKGGQFLVDWFKHTVADRLPANDQSPEHHHN